MKVHVFKREMIIPVSVSEAWDFFSDPRNLKKITPPEMNFKILTKNLPDRIYSGLLIKYSLTPVFGIKANWVTEIKNVKENEFFIDQQLEGPYALWEHKHSFIPCKEGTMMKDEVRYALPLSFLGDIAHLLFVRKKLEAIFNYRSDVISKLWLSNKNAV